MNAFKNIKKHYNKNQGSQFLGMEKYSGEIEYLYQKINNNSPPEISQSLMGRLFYIFDGVYRIYNAEGIKPKGPKSKILKTWK